MKIFLDTARLDEIKEAKAMGFLDGVTTNPSLIAKAGGGFEETIQSICEICEGPVSAECITATHDELVVEARRLAGLAPNVVVKIPLTAEGLKAVRTVNREGIKVNVTLCFSPLQALASAKAGAAFISPFVGRVDDQGGDGMELVEQIRAIYDNYGFETELLVASVRHPVHVLRAALLGADIATLPFRVLPMMLRHPLTDLGIKKFLEDYGRIPAGGR